MPSRRHTAAIGLHLRRALELAEGGRGRVSPNPLVGAVLVRDGEPIGEGFHAELGGPHAEVAALEDCRARGHEPSGATLYVTLEPCAHQGRQPPCTDAILAAGIGARRDRLGGPEREGERPRPGDPARRGHRGGAREWRGGGRRPTAESAVSKALPHVSPARRPEVGPQPRRSGGDRGRRLEVDLRRGQPGAGSPLAGGVRRRLRRDRHGARRRPAAHRPIDPADDLAPAHPGRLRLRGAAAAGLAARRLGRRGAAARDRRAGRAGRADRGPPRARGPR